MKPPEITDRVVRVRGYLSDEGFGYENIFRIAIVEFMDHHNFCLGRVKRSCIHFVTPHGQIIPFETYNMFYRDDAAATRMARSRGL